MSQIPLNKYYARIYNRYDLVNRIFTLGLDRKWRRRTAKICLETKPETILDLCCGTGDLAIELARQTRDKIKITGYDFSPEMLALADKKTASEKYPVEYIQGDAAVMPFSSGKFDALTIGFGFRNLVFENENSLQHLSEMNRVLKKEARLYILESAVPRNNLIRFLYKLYLSVFLIPLGGIISGNWKAYAYLARSSANFYSIREIKDLLYQQGFELIRTDRFFMGAAHLIEAVKK